MNKKLNLEILMFLILLSSLVSKGQTQLGQNIEVQESFASFAYSVSSSFDGSSVAIGAYGKTDWGFRVFNYNGSAWEQVGNDIPTEYPNEISIYPVALSANGNRVAVGAVINVGGFPDFGKVRIFEFNGIDWDQIGSDLIGESNNDFFGSRISLSSSGDRLIVGAKFNNSSRGNARVFEYNGIDWVQLGEDIDGDNDQFHFAESVAISYDGNFVAVGSNQFVPSTGQGSGLVRIYEYDGINWIQVGGDLIGEEGQDNFGIRISLSNVGNRIAIGANETITRMGYVKVYDFDGASWIQTGATLHGDIPGDRFGRMVSLSDDGNRLAIGSPSNDQNGNRPGLVKLYEFYNSNWVQLGDDIGGDLVLDEFGGSISISPDGDTVVIGALTYIYSQSGTEEGYAKVFDLSDLVLSIEDITDANRIVIYPNPAKEILRIYNSQDIKEIKIFDSMGRLVKHEALMDSEINISNFQNGLYLITFITTQNKIISLKLVKY